MKKIEHATYRCWRVSLWSGCFGHWSVVVRRPDPLRADEGQAPDFFRDHGYASCEEAMAAARGWIDAEYVVTAEGLWTLLLECGAVSAGMAG